MNNKAEDPNLWNNATEAQKLMRERQVLMDQTETYKRIERELTDNVELIELGEMEDDADIGRQAEIVLLDANGQVIHALPTTLGQ